MSNSPFLEACEMLKLENASESMIEFGSQGPYGPLRAGMRAGGEFELLIPLGHDTDHPDISDPGKMLIEARPLKTSSGVVRFCSVRPAEDQLQEPFARVADSISERVVNGSRVADAVESAVREFRALVEKERTPSRERLVGLYGELHFLLGEFKRYERAIGSWTGPTGSRHDFTLEGRALEVKTSTTPFPTKVRINGLHQLSPVGDDSLYLLVLGVEEVGEGGKTLSDLVDAVLSYQGIQDTLASKLGNLGISIHAIPDTPNYMVKSVKSFKVQEGFPRVEAGASLNPDGVPAIEDVTYTLHLAGLNAFTLSEDAMVGFTCPDWELV